MLTAEKLSFSPSLWLLVQRHILLDHFHQFAIIGDDEAAALRLLKIHPLAFPFNLALDGLFAGANAVPGLEIGIYTVRDQTHTPAQRNQQRPGEGQAIPR